MDLSQCGGVGRVDIDGAHHWGCRTLLRIDRGARRQQARTKRQRNDQGSGGAKLPG